MNEPRSWRYGGRNWEYSEEEVAAWAAANTPDDDPINYYEEITFADREVVDIEPAPVYPSWASEDEEGFNNTRSGRIGVIPFPPIPDQRKG